ncbi:hypothetical protein CEB3_c17500 [Peptococcaceae bacterium CEB3]|nr:hypothetical protein CEB3_c17500 [Peptococcaceae bacterium CEB3]
MSIHPAKMVAIWNKRIKLVRDRIHALRAKGIPSDDPDLKDLYERLRFMEECRRIALKDLAWEEV